MEESVATATDNRTIYIYLVDGSDCSWSSEEYDEYEVIKGLFVVKKGQQWIGIFPLSRVMYITVVED